MEFADFILILLYLVLAASLVAVVWSKMRVWWKTLVCSIGLAVIVGGVVWLLQSILGNEDNDTLWTSVADVFLVLIALSLLLTIGVVLWSMIRRR